MKQAFITTITIKPQADLDTADIIQSLRTWLDTQSTSLLSAKQKFYQDVIVPGLLDTSKFSYTTTTFPITPSEKLNPFNQSK